MNDLIPPQPTSPTSPAFVNPRARTSHLTNNHRPMLPDPDHHFLSLAARCALRAVGDVEPNPLVGAAIVRDGQLLGLGHHRLFGGPHAEVEAIESARRQGHADLRSSTLYVTLEPCSHHGKTPPCTEAIIAAGISTVIIAARDPNPIAARGAAALEKAGIEVRFTDASPLALAISKPFIKRTTTGLPWVIAKWAQTLDGRIATRTGDSKWISSAASRSRVHRLRARVDAIITGLGTVRADDPLLTARDVPRLRRTARRILVDPDLDIPEDAALIKSSPRFPLTIACSHSAASAPATSHKRAALTRAQAELLPLNPGPGGLDLEQLVRHLSSHHAATTVLIESGPVLLGSLLHSNLIDQVIIYIAPTMLGDERAVPPASGQTIERLTDAPRLQFIRTRRSGPDIEVTAIPIQRSGV